MSKEVEQAKERLKELCYRTRDARSKEERYINDQWLGLSNIEALETILAECERLEKMSKLTFCKECDETITLYNSGRVNCYCQECFGNLNNRIKMDTSRKINLLNMCKEKDKVIELMAKYISKTNKDEDICTTQAENGCDDINRDVECTECIIQYFENKAKGSE